MFGDHMATGAGQYRRTAWIALPAAFLAGLGLAAVLSPAAPKPEAGRAEEAPLVVSSGKEEELADLCWFRIGPRVWRPGSRTGEEIRDLLVGPSGDLWVRTNKGLSRLHGGAFQAVGRRQDLPHVQVVDVAATAAGVVVATSGGLAWIDGLAPPGEPAVLLGSDAVRSVAVHDGAIWFVVRATDGRRQIFRHPLDRDGRPVFDVRPTAVKVDRRIRRVFPALPGSVFGLDAAADLLLYGTRDGTVLRDGILAPDEALFGILAMGSRTWILTSERLLVLEDGAVAPTSVDVDLGDDTRLLAPGRDGRAWLGRPGELWQLDLEDGGIVNKFRLPAGWRPSALAEDLTGRIWVGSERGLLMADPRAGVFTLAEDSEGDGEAPFVAAGFDAGVMADPRTRRVFNLAGFSAGYGEAPFVAAGFDAGGRLWLGGEGRIVFPETAEGDCSEISVEGRVLEAFFGEQALALTTVGLLKLDGCKAARLELAAERLKPEVDVGTLRRFEKDESLLGRLQNNKGMASMVEARAEEEGVSLWDLDSRDRLLDWLLERFDEEDLLASESAVLAALDEEAVLRLRSEDVEEVHLWRAGVPNGGSEVPWSISTDQISEAVPDFASGGSMALTSDGNVLAFDADLKAVEVKAPDSLDNASLHHGAETGGVGRPLLATGRTLWKWTGGATAWNRQAELGSPESRVLGILPDLRGRGIGFGFPRLAVYMYGKTPTPSSCRSVTPTEMSSLCISIHYSNIPKSLERSGRLRVANMAYGSSKTANPPNRY